jgi:arylsulfatase A-like enzyme
VQVKRKYLSGDGDTDQTVSDNGPFRSGSGSLYEGGVRVPAIISWPGRIQPNISTERVHITDMYATLLEVAGASLSKNDQIKPIDGINISSILMEDQLLPQRTLILNVNEFGGAVLKNNWKLISISTLPSQTELYDIEYDPFRGIKCRWSAPRHCERTLCGTIRSILGNGTFTLLRRFIQSSQL